MMASLTARLSKQTPILLSRKHSLLIIYFSVPQTDTGGLVENTKAIGRKQFKELGKTIGRNLWEMPYLDLIGVAIKDAKRLFN